MQVDNETERHTQRERGRERERHGKFGKYSAWEDVIGSIGRYPVPVNEYLKMIEIPSCVNETLDYKMAMSLSRVVFA